jgi:toxin ParE1/3/4
MKIVWTRIAQCDFGRIDDFHADHDPQLAAKTARLAVKAARTLALTPHIGSALADGTRKWPVWDTPYVLIYRVAQDVVEILRVRHNRENWRDVP